MLTVSRRLFLTLPGVLGAGALVPRRARATGTVECACGAAFPKPHAYRSPAGFGLHCPNCGLEIRRGTFALDRRGFGAAHERAGAPSARWDCAQVPFPNPRLVGSTDKAAVTLESIRT